MTTSITDENILENGFLGGLSQEDQDVLDEFLDQRVYDSVGMNSPLSNPIKPMHSDVLEVFYQQDAEGNHIQMSGQEMFGAPASGSHSPSNSYMCMEPSQYTNAESLYASPLGHTSQQGDSPKSNSVDSNHSNGEDGRVANPNVDSSYMSVDNDIYSKQSNGYQLTDYEVVRDELAKLKFGNHNMNPCPDSIDVPDPSYLDFSPEYMAQLPFKLELSNLPSYSRVETQIKLKFSVSPSPSQVLLHIPQDLISKNKFCLNEPLDSLSQTLKENLLYLDAYVLTSDMKKSCNICSRCIKREQKRASRRKSGVNGNESENVPEPTNYTNPYSSSGVVKNNPNSWADEKMIKKAIIFNCKEIVSFPPPNGLNDSSKSLELSARIICYCRHHKESEGFRLLFVVKNANGDVVGKSISSTIMIMDRKKNTSSTNKSESVANSAVGSSTNLQNMNDSKSSGKDALTKPMHPISPNSIDESASEPQTNTDTNQEGKSLKRKKLSVDDSYNNSTNPMFNGSINGFSPVSNSDTNTSVNNVIMKNNTQGIDGQLSTHLGLSNLGQPIQQSNMQQNLPAIQRIIPARGPVRGGIEVTLLGFNFRPGLQVKFGANQALATHCWSETTIVTYLPPAAHPGQVLVSFDNHESMIMGSTQQSQIFTYTDDTDRQLIELALQIVGLKMNGKLEDAKNIAKRIVGSDGSASNSPSGGQSNTTNSSPAGMNQASMEWYDNAHKAVEKLTKSNLSTEELLIDFLSLVNLPNCPIIIPNWQLSNSEGQSLLHLATLRNYKNLIRFLVARGCKTDVQDNQGLTPLFLASMCGHRDLIKIYVECKCNWNMRLSNEKQIKDYCDPNVLDIFQNLEVDDVVDQIDSKDEDEYNVPLTKSLSIDSLNSVFRLNYGCHISKMVIDNSVQVSAGNKMVSGDRHVMRSEFNPMSSSHDESNSEFADSEFDSDDDMMDDEDDYEDRSDYVISDSESEDEVYNFNDNHSVTSNSTIVPIADSAAHSSSTTHQGLWSKVKQVFNNSDDDSQLPSYDDLFPFGPSSFHSRPKTTLEKQLNQDTKVSGGIVTESSSASMDQQEDTGITSDSSEDMVISIEGHQRKNFENDKMLLFFWFPVLVLIIGIFVYATVTGYTFETLENAKDFIRSAIGNLVVGNERLSRVFNKENAVERMLMSN